MITIIIITIQPFMALQSLVAPNLPQEVPPIFSTPSYLLHPCIPRMCNASLWTMSFPLLLGVPTDLVSTTTTTTTTTTIIIIKVLPE